MNHPRPHHPSFSRRAALAGLTGAALAGTDGVRRFRHRGHASACRPLRHLQRLAEPRHPGRPRHGPVHAGQPAGTQRRRDHPAGRPRRPADQRVRLRRGRHRGPACSCATTWPSARTARSRSASRTASPRPSTPVSPPAWTSTARTVPSPRRVPTRTGRTPSGTAGSRASTAWSSSPSTRSTSARPVPSSTSCGRTCPATSCRRATTARRPRAILRLSSKSHWDLPIRARPRFLLHRALPRLASDSAHLRRDRGPQRAAQPRRDPAVGRLHRGAAARGVPVRRPGGTGWVAGRGPFRDRG